MSEAESTRYRAWILSVGFLAANWYLASSHEMCVDSTFPQYQDASLSFCKEYSEGRSCCAADSLDTNGLTLTDEDVEEYYETALRMTSLGFSTNECKRLVKQVMCSRCDPWSAHLYEAEGSQPSNLVRLCPEYCGRVYSACGPLLLSQLPETMFVPLFSQYAFCNAASAKDSYCYEGEKYELPSSERVEPGPDVESICVEKVLDTTPDHRFIDIIKLDYAEEDDRALLVTQDGLIEIYKYEEDEEMEYLGEFLDIRDRVIFEGEKGLLGLALHPNFAENGRFFVSYSCSTEVDECETAGDSIIEEYFVSQDELDTIDPVADSNPEKTILYLRQPYENHNGGQILFGRTDDPFMYIVFGDGGAAGDPKDFSQEPDAFLGKILRIDIDSSDEPYLIPEDNPFIDNDNVADEVWALGLRNAWRCSFDAVAPHRMFCGDVGQDEWEEVSIIEEGGNYGWAKFEGSHVYAPLEKSNLRVSNHIPPIIEYSHVELDRDGAASIAGGFVYRSKTDSCLYGKYVFGDYYDALFTAQEQIDGSWTRHRIAWECAKDSPLSCDENQDELYTFGEIGRDVYWSTLNGIYRIVSPAKCDRPTCD